MDLQINFNSDINKQDKTFYPKNLQQEEQDDKIQSGGIWSFYFD